MSRRPTAEERRLVLKLVGPDFGEIDIIGEQLDNSTVTELDSGAILEFQTLKTTPLTVPRTNLGMGSLRDFDDVPIVFILLQRGGYIWRLDIAREDSGRIHRALDYDAVLALGYGNGLSLEWDEKPRT